MHGRPRPGRACGRRGARSAAVRCSACASPRAHRTAAVGSRQRCDAEGSATAGAGKSRGAYRLRSLAPADPPPSGLRAGPRAIVWRLGEIRTCYDEIVSVGRLGLVVVVVLGCGRTRSDAVGGRHESTHDAPASSVDNRPDTIVATQQPPLPFPICKDDPRGRGRDGHCCRTNPDGYWTICGAYDKEVLRRALRRQMATVMECYGTADDAGCVQPLIDFTITSKGDVAQAAVRSFRNSSKDRPHLRACIIAAVRRWQFPMPADGESVLVRYPFNPDFAGPCNDD